MGCDSMVKDLPSMYAALDLIPGSWEEKTTSAEQLKIQFNSSTPKRVSSNTMRRVFMFKYG